jgi:hypothetical protein
MNLICAPKHGRQIEPAPAGHPKVGWVAIVRAIEPVFPYVAKRNQSKSTLVARNKQLRPLTFGFDLFSFALVCGQCWSNLAQVLIAIARTRGQIRYVRPAMSTQGAHI